MPRSALILRERSTDEGTFSDLHVIDGDIPGAERSLVVMVGLELGWHDNEPQYSCIPSGIYDCALSPTSKWSPRNGTDLPQSDKMLFQVMAVPGRSQIKIHAATWAGDVRKDWHSDLLGCIAPGIERGMLKPPEVPSPQHGILRSRLALTKFMKMMGDGPFRLEIRWKTPPVGYG